MRQYGGTMFSKILIANRGEIAVRVIQACRELGVETVAVYSTADRESLHVQAADEAICIGPPPVRESYLNESALITAAEITGAQAVHPGYGLLAEQASFAEKVERRDLAWIGPRSETIRRMGDKSAAREAARDAGAPLLPGSREPLKDAAQARTLAARLGYPVIVKAASGGGGRGLRVAQGADQIETQFLAARSEAEAVFGDDALYLEKFLVAPRHVEVQILGDREGRVIHLGERECSIQRRHQKLVEESPSPALTDALRERITAIAVDVAASVAYENAGTVEFLLDDGGNFYFLEMNTRIQVEHPVTEIVTDFDLVKEQIRLAAGEPLSLEESRTPRRHAIECRINAEHPRTFTPSPGTLTVFRSPGGPGVRVDSHAYAGYRVPPFYDSLLAKVIGFGVDREEALARVRRAVDEFEIEGIATNLDLHRRILRSPRFVASDVSTGFMEDFLLEP